MKEGKSQKNFKILKKFDFTRLLLNKRLLLNIVSQIYISLKDYDSMKKPHKISVFLLIF